MWYAASEIVFFLVLAAVIGGLIGYGTAQIYQIDFAALRAARASHEDRGAELAAAYAEIADLRRKLQITTDALRDAPGAHRDPLDVAPLEPADVAGQPDSELPSRSDDDDGDDAGAQGRRLSERVAEAERS